MRIGSTYSHLNGHEWMIVHRGDVWQNMVQVIESVDADSCRTKVSREKRTLGKVFVSPVDMNTRFRIDLHARGWQESRTSYWVTDDARLVQAMMHLRPEE